MGIRKGVKIAIYIAAGLIVLYMLTAWLVGSENPGDSALPGNRPVQEHR